MNTPDATAVDREKFLALYTSYARAYERFLENGFKTSTTLLIVLGWLIGSENAQIYFKDHDSIRWIAITLITLGAAFLYSAFRRLSYLSGSLRDRLDKLNFVDRDAYTQHEIPPMIYWSVVGQNLLICAFIVGMLLSFAWP